jgi:hypothetical protein
MHPQNLYGAPYTPVISVSGRRSSSNNTTTAIHFIHSILATDHCREGFIFQTEHYTRNKICCNFKSPEWSWPGLLYRVPDEDTGLQH